MSHVDIVLNVNGIDYPVTVDPRPQPAQHHPHRDRAHRHQGGLRRLRVRRVHGAARRPAGELVLVPGRAGAGRPITTVEGVMAGDELHPLQRNLLDEGGVQCGFCTPGMIMSATALLGNNPSPTEEEIRIGLSGNLCRCTGYAKIVAAVQRTAAGTP